MSSELWTPAGGDDADAQAARAKAEKDAAYELVSNAVNDAWLVFPLEALQAAVRKLPAEMVKELAKGPLEEPNCRLCKAGEAQGEAFWENCEEDVAVAYAMLLDFHELVKEQLVVLDQSNALDWRFFGRATGPNMDGIVQKMISLICFTRCQLIYAVAGRIALEGN